MFTGIFIRIQLLLKSFHLHESLRDFHASEETDVSDKK